MTWALKRCLRAAFERETLSTRRTRAYGDNFTGDDIAGANADDRENADGRGGGIGRVYTRDLYYCAGLASDARPEPGSSGRRALRVGARPRAVWGALWYACGSALVRAAEGRSYSLSRAAMTRTDDRDAMVETTFGEITRWDDPAEGRRSEGGARRDGRRK